MNKIIKKIQYSEKVFRFDVEAPLIAKSRKAGNFVIIRVDNNSERMPLTIADADIEKGTITLVVQKVGLSSTKLCALNEGDEIHDVVGPLGNPTHIENFGTVICAGGGVGLNNVSCLKDYGFGGVVILGDIWNRFSIHSTQDFKDLIQHFRKLRKAVE